MAFPTAVNSYSVRWPKAVLAGVAGGVVMWLVDFLLHGVIMADTYARYPVFRKDGNPVYFLLSSVLIAFFAAVLFAKTRGCWGGGWSGGATFGFFLGLFMFFTHFTNALVIEGFPYYLSWCWGGMALISLTAMGATLGLVYREA